MARLRVTLSVSEESARSEGTDSSQARNDTLIGAPPWMTRLCVTLSVSEESDSLEGTDSSQARNDT